MNSYERYLCGLSTTCNNTDGIPITKQLEGWHDHNRYIINDIKIKDIITIKGDDDMTNRAIMNTMKKDMRVKWCGAYGVIKAFDYNHLKVGVVLDTNKNIMRWANPSYIEIIYTNKFSYKGPKPNKVIADIEAGVTVVMWDDGEKTIVRTAEGTTPDVYNAFCAAFCKRMYGTNSALKRHLNDILVIKEKKENKKKK